MRTQLISYVAIFEIFSTIFPIGLATTPNAFADEGYKDYSHYTPPADSETDKANRTKCNVGCNGYQTALKTTLPLTCGTKEGVSKEKPASYNGQSYDTYEDCAKAFMKSYTLIGPYCDSRELAGQAADYQLGLSIAYGAVAATCVAASIADFSDPTKTVSTVLDIACGVANLGALGSEIGLIVAVGDKGKSLTLNNKTYSATGITEAPVNAATIGGGAMGVGAGVAGIAAAVSRIVATRTVEVTAKTALSVAGISALIAAAFAVTAAASYGAGLGNSIATANTQCANAIKTGFPATDPRNNLNQIATSPSGNYGANLSQPTQGTGTANKSSKSGAPEGMAENFPGAQMSSAASSGPFAALMNNLPNKDKIPSALDSMGLGLDGLANKMKNGESLASIMGGIEGMSPEASEMMAELTQAASESKQFDSTMTGGGGKGPSGSGDAGPNLMSFFGPKAGADAVGGTQALEFGSKTPSLGEGNDIWHSGAKGSIFQIVSQKIEKNSARIDQLEWATPLNRALNGLAAQPRAKNQPAPTLRRR